MTIFKCKMCGGSLEITDDMSVAKCQYCGTKQTLPRLDDDRRANLYDRANHFRRNNEFDKAMGIYEQILNEDSQDAEAYWSLVLCRYGIEYVEDPATHKRVATVNRAQYTSIFADADYRSAIQYADAYQKTLYEQEARVIDEIQKGILDISNKEDPFDVFICYKETDNGGQRTPDSVLANDLYHELTQEGYKVFFSRITLEDKLGDAYEPYIFAALNSAKVMVVLGTKAEHFNAVWVKNEWSRFLALIRGGAKKILIPAFRDMDPYDLPEEFSHLQAQDMSKLGFMQDLLRGIKKILHEEEGPVARGKELGGPSSSSSLEPLLERAFMFLADGDWQKADSYCERVLDMAPKNALAYVGKMMAELHVSQQGNLADLEQPFDQNKNFVKAVQFADEALSDELNRYITYINERNEKTRRDINERNEKARKDKIYKDALNKMQFARQERKYKEAAEMFLSVKGYEKSDVYAKECLEKADIARKDWIYNKACENMAERDIDSYKKAIKDFKSIIDWKDSREKIRLCEQKKKEIQEEARREEKKEKILSIAIPIIVLAGAILIFLALW